MAPTRPLTSVLTIERPAFINDDRPWDVHFFRIDPRRFNGLKCHGQNPHLKFVQQVKVLLQLQQVPAAG